MEWETEMEMETRTNILHISLKNDEMKTEKLTSSISYISRCLWLHGLEYLLDNLQTYVFNLLSVPRDYNFENLIQSIQNTWNLEKGLREALKPKNNRFFHWHK